MRGTIQTLLFAAGCVAAVPACAQAQDPAGVGCQALPSAASWLARNGAGNDVRGMLENHLREAARSAGIAAPRGIVFAEVGSGRARARVWSYRSNVPDQLSSAVMERHREQLSRWTERNGLLNLRLDPPAAPDSATVECMPVLVNADELARELRRISAPPSSTPGATRTVSLRVTMLVTREGEVAHAALDPSTADRDLDRALLQVVRRLRFRPAAIQNVPLDVWVEQSVSLELPPP